MRCLASRCLKRLSTRLKHRTNITNRILYLIFHQIFTAKHKKHFPEKKGCPRRNYCLDLILKII